ncbi:flagellar protein [Saccharibacillus sp. CPCC 101409]|uniref:TIGR03826 family flagellar region protein n=1 Tax=Saccharibacillus sp. CPCC 101409 TaxID=3058041 RepID=UPI0026732265|nr:TIGR03826 family flagellar region protein [Saccharibacillus sp. CPCC 101409]MDO3412087.1 flagellar protein [Saccharibacillus sp. CPCC 101409]
MNLANCPRCGKLFVMNYKGICTNCMKDIEAEYEACVKYLRENKGANIQELSDETDVSIRQITTFIRDGRISIANAPNMGYPCEVCGTMLREGNMCESCRSKLTSDLREASKAQPQVKKSNPGGAYKAVDRIRND